MNKTGAEKGEKRRHGQVGGSQRCDTGAGHKVPATLLFNEPECSISYVHY